MRAVRSLADDVELLAPFVEGEAGTTGQELGVYLLGFVERAGYERVSTS